MSSVYLCGAGLWACGFADVTAWQRGAVDPAVTIPRADCLPLASRRRAPLLARMSAQAGSQAAAQASADLAQVALVLGSVYGEIETAVEMIRSFHEGDGMPSPTRFHNSVHNTAAGYLSIAAGNRGFSTALAAGEATAAMALLEAGALLAIRGNSALVILADEPVPTPFGDPVRYPAASVAFLLSAEARPGALARLGPVRRGEDAEAESVALPDPFARHPCAGGFALLAAIQGRRPRVVSLSAGAERWVIDVEELFA